MNRCESSFHFEGDILRVRYTGLFSESPVVSTIEAFSRDARISRIKGVMWDLQSADVSELNLKMMQQVFKDQAPLPLSRAIRIGAVAGSDIDLQILRLWAVGHGAKDGFDRYCFRHPEEARAWLLDAAHG